MTQRTPRIQLTLKPEARSIFERLAAAQERPIATIISEFLDETAPALQNVVSVVERAKDAVSRAGKQERERFAIAESQLLQHHHTAISAMHGAEAAVGQLALDLGRMQSAQHAVASTARLRRAVREFDPHDTNRGVNNPTTSRTQARK